MEESPLDQTTPSPPPNDMEIHAPPPFNDESSALWDFTDLLDFTVDDQFLLSSLDATESDAHHDAPQILPENPGPDRVRKRDPRLTCSNFLAGRVPCACPEMDAKLAEEESVMPGKKRARVSRVGVGPARCQVPGCEVDISELKGYHKRHRVCLRCANASGVELDGEIKRYCQQCGKFHLLSDFDEGKRSCRRKLERHNNRRRRKPLESKGSLDKEPRGDLQTEYTAIDSEEGKDGQTDEKEQGIEFEDGHVSTLHSAPSSQTLNTNSDSGGASGETHVDGGKDDSKFSLSPSCCETKSAYSSMCPTGRISFKLYDWNPAEFPRRLRHQIFQWLANMPVELEGYIRPGCTILTSFIAMPTFMWGKLLEDPISYMHDFVIVPGKMLSKKGPMIIYLNDMIFHVLRDGTSIMRVKMEGLAPRLHYVHPMYFEAGKPIEFVACGSNLLRPKFRFLVSFGGKYLEHSYYATSSHCQTGRSSSLDHQLCKISIFHVEPNLFGPAFIEVENESGLSNFIPILIGDSEICSEMKTIEQRYDASHLAEASRCEVLASRQLAFSDFVVDVAWLLREPSSENFQQLVSSSQIQRCNSLLKFLIYHESTTILCKVLENLKIMMDKMEVLNGVINGSYDADVRLLQNYINYASGILREKLKETEGLALQMEYPMQERDCLSGSCSESDMPLISDSEDLEKTLCVKSGLMASSTPINRSGEVPFLDREVIMNASLVKESSSKACSNMFSNKVLKSRPTIFVIAIVAVCFGACAVFLHPNKVARFAITIRRCLTDRF